MICSPLCKLNKCYTVLSHNYNLHKCLSSDFSLFHCWIEKLCPINHFRVYVNERRCCKHKYSRHQLLYWSITWDIDCLHNCFIVNMYTYLRHSTRARSCTRGQIHSSTKPKLWNDRWRLEKSIVTITNFFNYCDFTCITSS